MMSPKNLHQKIRFRPTKNVFDDPKKSLKHASTLPEITTFATGKYGRDMSHNIAMELG